MITTGMGEELREALKAFVYVECSVRKRLSLHAVFEEAARSVLSTSSLLSVSPGDDGRDIGGAKGMPSWLESYLDVHLFDEAVRFRAQKRDLISRMDTAKYLDRWRADGAAVYCPPSWAIEDTEIDTPAYSTAFLLRAPRKVLLSKEATYKYLDAKRAAGYEGPSKESATSDSQLPRRFGIILAEY
eukprot:gene11666-13553_t